MDAATWPPLGGRPVPDGAGSAEAVRRVAAASDQLRGASVGLGRLAAGPKGAPNLPQSGHPLTGNPWSAPGHAPASHHGKSAATSIRRRDAVSVRSRRVIAASGETRTCRAFGMTRLYAYAKGRRFDGYESQKTSKVPLVTAWTYDAAPARTRRCSSVHAAFERPGWTSIVRNVGRSCATSVLS